MSDNEVEIEDNQEDNHLENIYKLLNEHTALISENQQTTKTLVTTLLETLKAINENMSTFKNEISTLNKKINSLQTKLNTINPTSAPTSAQTLVNQTKK